MDDKKVQEICDEIGQDRRFATFGGGQVRSSNNPISVALKDCPLEFAAGVNVAEVVRFVLARK